MKSVVIGYHGCSPNASGVDDAGKYFTVPSNATIIYFNSNGVISRGDNNIPFVVNLYNINRTLFNYIFDKHTYGLNLDKTNINSYRHADFFKQFPFYSSFNFLCNFEMYTSGSPCPQIKLTLPSSTRTHTFFEGITNIENIITNNTHGKQPTFHDTSGVIIKPNINSNSSIMLDTLLSQLTIKNETLFFISACRVEFYHYLDKWHMINIDPIERNCLDFNTFDIHKIKLLYDSATDEINKLAITKCENLMRLRYNKQKQLAINVGISNINGAVYYNVGDYKIALFHVLFDKSDFEIVINFSKIRINGMSNITDRINSIRDAIFRTATQADINLLTFILRYIRDVYNILDTPRNRIVCSFDNAPYVKYAYIYDLVEDAINTAITNRIDLRDAKIIAQIIDEYKKCDAMQHGGKYIKYIKKTSNLIDFINNLK